MIQNAAGDLIASALSDTLREPSNVNVQLFETKTVEKGQELFQSLGDETVVSP